MSIILKMTAPSAAASWLDSGAVARPRPVLGDCPPSGFEYARGAFGIVASANAVLDVPGARRTNPILANLPQMSTTGTTNHQYRQRFRYWSPPN